MKSIIITALSISFKIWVIALLLNTIADSVLLDGFSLGLFEIALIIALFGGIFSAPVFLILWSIIYKLLQTERTAGFILRFLLLAGTGLAVASWIIFAAIFHFYEAGTFGLAIVAPLSGAVAICISYPNIKKACHARDANKMLIETLGTE